jgi:integrase
MLNIQRRHSAPCKKPVWDKYMKCGCTLYIRGTLKGNRVSAATTRFLPPQQANDPEAARNLAILWERRGALCRPDEFAPVAEKAEAEPEPELPTIERAVKAYIADATDRNNAEATLQKKKLVYEKLLLRFAREKGLRFLSELTLAMLQEWRSTWKVNALVKHKRQSNLIGFLWFCERAGWFHPGHADAMTKGLGKIQVQATQTGYFDPEDYRKILDATWLYSDRPSIDKHNGLQKAGGDRIRALMELMRWTGLRIGDAVTLEKWKLLFDERSGIWSIMVRQTKTGDPVWCAIPPDVAEMLRKVPASQKGNTNERYFFWTGSGKKKTIITNWERSFQKLFALTDLKWPDGRSKRAFPHMFRDTFAVESLLSGMSLHEVKDLLGHQSVTTTEDHYMPWVRARQAALLNSVQRSWVVQGKVTPISAGTALKGRVRRTA